MKCPAEVRRAPCQGDDERNQRLKSKGGSSPAILGEEEDLKKEIESKAGVLRLKPNFVARTFYPGLNRLGLEDADAGERGAYVERWIVSCVESASPNSTPNE